MHRSILLDSLRIVAIVLVFLAHLGQLLGHNSGDFFGWKNIYFVSLGGVGVSLFLVLSGVLAGLGATPRHADHECYLTYLLKKILRIYPLYLLSVPLAVLGYALSEGLLQGDFPDMFPNGIATDLTGSLTGFYAWAGLWGGPYNPPSWFISLIMSLYALCPLLLWAIKRRPHQALLALFCISLGARYYVGQWGIPFADPSLYDNLQGWLYRQYGVMPGRPGDWFPPCRLFEFALGIYLVLRLPNRFWFRLQLPFNNAIRWLSDLAFPLFLVHYPFLFLVTTLTDLGLPMMLAIAVYMGLMLVLAHWINQLDMRIPRKRIIARL
ncbi:acyltransferase family protein [Pontibacter sp. JAM-7]|uniref:acyltransferase family protein n=1 Tax=Pontibacter sp. JAM-7 TaxID=3366581 RepID=UPI003AF67584